MTDRLWMVGICLLLVPLLARAEERRFFEKEAFGRMAVREKGGFLKSAAFDSPGERSLAVEYFTSRWNEEDASVLASFCEAMGRAKAQEAIPVLVEHIDFRYLEDMSAERPRTVLEGRVALDALAQIGLPALEPAVQHIVGRLSKVKDRHELYFFREAFAHLALKSLGKTRAKEYVRSVIEKAQEDSVRRELEAVEAEL